MSHFQSRRVAIFGRAALVFLCVGYVAEAAPGFSCSQYALMAQSASQSKRDTQSRQQKLANPLNDLLDEAQRDIDANNFEAALAPLQKFIAEKPEVPFAHFQLRYAYPSQNHRHQSRAR